MRLVAVLTLSACAKRETPAEAGLRTQTLLLGNNAEPADLDPHTMTALTEGNIVMALFDGLTQLEEQTSVVVPSLAEKWETSPNGLMWTFHLRAGLKWSNGDPLTADDFVQSWRRLLAPALGAENAYLLYPIRNAEAINTGKPTEPIAAALSTPEGLGVAAPDPRTLIVSLARPTPHFTAITAHPSTFPINPRVLHQFGAMNKRGTAWTRPGKLVGNGAFTLKEWTPNARIVVARNPNFWDAAKTRLNEVIFFPTENPDVDERNFRAGQIHATFTLPVAKVAAWREREPAKLRSDPILQTVFLRFNLAKSPLDDARVRRALSLATDRETLARTVLAGSRAPAFALTPPDIAGYTSRARANTDFAAARKLLADSGHEGGRGLPVFELQCRSDEIQPKLAEALQAMWQRELGVRIELAPTEEKTWLQNQQTRNYAITFGSWVADYPDAGNFLGLFTANAGYNWTGWSNADYDRLLVEAAPLADRTRQHELFQRAEALLLEAAPIAPIFHGAQTYLLDPAVKGWTPSKLGFRRYQLARLEK